ncbi:hypothetical protein JW613_33125 [Streptomyces smyrnaeus]|uniref:Large membrane protein n=1 Tax=Streptomyces smyrnaeus TaxID=1387713 RepID=A0ABS3Y640_9ACTN|nr:hypothetical protein [Streptomyces smyrnaeus]MBO8203086.1 hypothetical protein [Streptomyces smyrnaeus]
MSTDQSSETEGRPAPRSRRRQLSVVAVAAAVLVAGGGGAYWASSAFDGDTGGSGRGAGSDNAAGGERADGPPKLALDGTATSARDSGEGIAPGEPMGPRGYRAEGELPDGPESAAVRKPGHDVSRGQVAKLAEALKVKGGVKAEEGRWQAGGGQGKGPRLTAERGGAGGAWTYQNGDTVPLDAEPDPAPGGKPLSAAEAKDAVRPALRALGLKDAELDAGSAVGGTRTVTASPKVAGMPTHGWDSTFVVDDKGSVTRAQGSWNQTRKGAVYPVQSATATLDQLNKASQSRGGHAGEGEQGKEPTKIGDAVFGLSLERSHGKPLLVPAWIYEVKRPGGGDMEVTHPAVKPEHLKPSKTSGHPGKPGSGDVGSGGAKAVQAAESYRVAGRTLKLTFWGGVCDTYKATAEESGSEVKVRIEAEKKKDGKNVCVKIAKRQTVEVELDKKLGDRKVLDVRDGKQLPRK